MVRPVVVRADETMRAMLGWRVKVQRPSPNGRLLLTTARRLAAFGSQQNLALGGGDGVVTGGSGAAAEPGPPTHTTSAVTSASSSVNCEQEASGTWSFRSAHGER